MHGGAKLHLRSTNSKFLALVDSWWSVLLPRIAPYLYNNGGPILMIQACWEILFSLFFSASDLEALHEVLRGTACLRDNAAVLG